MIEIKDLEDIIGSFAADNKIFSKEAQFQFDLAWEIRNRTPEFDVILEYLWRNNMDKQYIDIVVFGNQECVPIELKYKTAGRDIKYVTSDNKEYWTFNQGAYDIGSYDYLKDISRLESLEKELEYKGKKYTVNKGFSIILTNESKYFEKLEERNRYNNFYYWKNFSLAQSSIGGDIRWVDKESGQSKDNDFMIDGRKYLHLNNKYDLLSKWKPYNVRVIEPKESKFMYLITEVVPKEK